MTKSIKKPFNVIANAKFKVQSQIVAVGASAGGLEALKAFFEAIPKTDKNTYVVIQHLSPDFKSMMGELLGKTAHLPVENIKQDMLLEPGKIYLIPPANNLVVKNGLLHLIEKPRERKLNLPIDLFFTSLADYKKDQAIGVILSGTGSDGTRGLRAIKEKGGLVMVQEPSQAKFNGMPNSAIRTGIVDYVLKAEEMGPELDRFINSPLLVNLKNEEVRFKDQTLSKVLHLVDKQTGNDFKEYKKSTIIRRIARRMNVCQCNSLEEYYYLLSENAEEIKALRSEFLIGVTKFFRDLNVWDFLEDTILPDLLRRKKKNDILKIWDVGCSTGEEAFSLAMYLQEEIKRQQKQIEIKIFATDISEVHLDVASKGKYPQSIQADIPIKLLNTYFEKTENSFQISEDIRKMVVFSKHDILKDPPLSRMDMVICRNMLIYFQPSLQEKSMDILHYALKKNAYLVLGTSESLNNHKHYFKEVSRKWKIFKNQELQKRMARETLRDSSIKSKSCKISKENKENRDKPMDKKQENKAMKHLAEKVLEQFGGASVYIDKDFNILQSIGQFKKYASLPNNGFSMNLKDMLGEDLKPIVQSTVKKSSKEQGAITYRDAHYKLHGEQKSLDLIVEALMPRNLNEEKIFALCFIEKEVNLKELKETDKVTVNTRAKEYIAELEEELKDTKRKLRDSQEEIESSNQELQSANEELLASNEELQSTNEELQSVNEEINTVNSENLQKMEDLAELNADMNNLLESTNIGTIFLDHKLKIRKFTPAIRKHFSLINSDLGRPIEHFTNSFGKIRGKGIVERCEKVMKTGKTLERNILSREGFNYLQRISPFINSEDRIEGVVITFVDIESLQKAKDRLVASERRFKSFYEEDPVLHFSVDPHSSLIVQCNQEAVERLEYKSKEEIIGKPIFDLYEDESQLRALKLNKIFKEKGELKNIEQKMLTKTGKVVPIIMNSTVELDEEGNGITNRFTCVDISELKTVQKELREQKTDLERANRDLEQFVSICSHDLQEPLSTIKFGSDVLGKIYAKQLDDKGKEYLRYIDQASDRLSNQIKALLEHSRIGKNTKKTLVDTNELVEVVKYDLGKRIRDNGAKVHVGNMPKLKAYEVELRLLFQNLLSNALKYTSEDRKPEIRISSYPEGEFWVFSVMDNGIGISKEDQKNIFTIFNRVRTEHEYEGTGVGLAHVEKIVQLHEGSIWLDSQPGVGSTFYFKIKDEK